MNLETSLALAEKQSYPVSGDILHMASSLVEDGGGIGVSEPVQTILEDFQRRKGQPFSEEHKKRLSEALKRSWQRPECRAKHSGENNPMKRPEVRVKLSESMKRRWSNPKARIKHSELMREAMKRPENKAKRSEWMKRIWQRPEVKAKHIEAMKRPEVKAKLSESGKRAFQRPEVMANHSGENSGRWRGGISFLPYCPKFNESRKEQVRNDYERTCVSCGKSEILEGRRLSVHHIDGDKMQGCNGKRWFLMPLCKSCHGELHGASEQKSIELEFLLVTRAEQYRRAAR